MNIYHISIEQDEGWLVGRVLERQGITTQGRSLDELVFMVRDAIQLMWNEKDVQLELLVPREAATSYGRQRSNHAAKQGRRTRKTAAST